jgi:hypothetical protein
MMWTLVLFTMLVNTSPGGGAQSNVTILDFASEGACLSAAKVLAEEGGLKNETSTAFRITAKCIQRSSLRGRF